MTGLGQKLGLPLVGLALVAAVLGVQLANGGGSFEPLRPADPCVARTVTSQSPGVEGLTERLVLLGIDGAACRLGVSREALTLQLAGPGERSDREISALRQGLKTAVRQLDADGSLPAASDLVDEVLETADLPGYVKSGIRLLPDSVVDGALKTDDVLIRMVDKLDLRAVLANIDDQDDLEARVEDAVVPAVQDSLVARLRDLVPSF